MPQQLQAVGRDTVVQQSAEPEQAREFLGAPLNAPALVEAFLEKNILCTILTSKDVLEKNSDALLRSDILVLDWKLGDDGCMTARFITDCACKHRNALRMICIYTSEIDIESIEKKLDNELKKQKNSSSLKIINNGIYSIYSTYILVVNKKDFKTDTIKRAADEAHLPEVLFSEFAQLVGGLLRNAVFHAISAIRNNTYTLLNRFHPELDSAFVSHRAFSNPCEDTEEHIIPMIASEIGNILHQAKISSELKLDKIKNWIEYINIEKIFSDLTQQKNFKNSLNFKEKLEKAIELILTSGIDKKYNESESNNLYIIEEIKKYKSASNIKKSNLTKLFGAQNPSLADIKLSMLMSCVYFYQDIIPIMQSGTIIKEKIDNLHENLHDNENKKINEKYYCCIQPPCDCYRIESKGRPFLFIPLEKVNNESLFDISFVNEDISKDPVYLSKNKKIYNLEVISFAPQKDNENICAIQEEETYIFNSTDGRKFVFCAQLNEIHALRFIQTYSSTLARIGLMESDWQRRCSK